MNRLLRLMRTVSYLRPVQIWGRAWFRLYRPRVDARPAPPLREPGRRWQSCARTPSMTGPQTFHFLNCERTLNDASDWTRTDWPHLWRYNLHYFDDLVADAAVERLTWQRALIARWIEDNPPATGTGWESYPTSLRIVNWVKWALSGNTLDDTARDSLAIQARWLRKREEIHLQGNHLWANAKALVFAGALFSGEEAEHWHQHGLTRIRHELAEQILPDGGHYERSPMYHAIVLEDLLDLTQLATIYPDCFDTSEAAHWQEIATRMLRWLRVMSHPDGGIALFNDAALGIAPDCAALHSYANILGLAPDEAALSAIEVLPDSGYVRLTAGPAVLMADVGEIGPSHLPGHAHADTLSFELSLHGERVLVNGGTSSYAAGPERLRQRGTAAHNTVLIDGENSSEVWSSFRVARRAHPIGLAYDAHGDELRARAGHHGYQRLSGRPVHWREWRLSNSRLMVTDNIDGSFAHAEARLHVHPSWDLATEGTHGTLAKRDQAPGTMAIRWHSTPTARIAQSSYHPRFGVTEPCQLIEVPFDAEQAQFTLDWNHNKA